MSLKVIELSKRFENKWALRNVSFEVQPGRIVGIFGLSGSGKTTLIDAISGRIPVDGGSVQYNGADVTSLSTKERNFHYPALSNESIWRSLFKTDKSSQLADGEGQSLALDAAIEAAEGVLLLDNPFCDMDPLMRQANFTKLQRAAQDKRLSVIVATSDFLDVLQLCSEAVVLSGGEVVQAGSPKEIYESPATATVAAITGLNNLITARRLSSSKAEITEFQTIEGDHKLYGQKAGVKELGPLNQNITLAIRPEHISISFGASFPEDNLLKAVITGTQFLGPVTVVSLDANGLILQALVRRLVGLDIGEECMVSLPPDRIRVLTK